MNEKELVAVGVGDVPAWLADEGLVLAEKYFEAKGLNPEVCYEAKINESNKELARNWDEAEKKANNVLSGDSRYKNSMINLEYDVY